MTESMPDGIKIALTALAAVGTFVVGQFIQRIFIEPLQEQRRVIGRVAHALTFYRGVTIDAKRDKPTDEQVAAVRAALRGLAADLRSTLTVLPWYRMFAAVRLALPTETVKQVAYQLMRWELFMSDNAMTAAVTSAARLLKLDYIEDEWTEFQKMMGLKVKPFTDDDETPGNGQSKIGAVFPRRSASAEEFVQEFGGANGEQR